MAAVKSEYKGLVQGEASEFTRRAFQIYIVIEYINHGGKKVKKKKKDTPSGCAQMSLANKTNHPFLPKGSRKDVC